MSDNAFTVRSPLGYDICCSGSTWNGYIVPGHRIMEKNIEAVKKALEDPVAIYPSKEWPKRDVYFGLSDIATYKRALYTKVVIDTPDEYNKEESVVSAWPQEDISGNIDEGEIKYVKPKPR